MFCCFDFITHSNFCGLNLLSISKNRRSGTEEQYGEMEQLLDDMSYKNDMEKEKSSGKASKQLKKNLKRECKYVSNCSYGCYERKWVIKHMCNKIYFNT